MALEWAPWGVRRDGPANKTGYPWGKVRAGRGAVVHSMEGSFAAAMTVLDGPTPASWHFTVLKDGTFAQHYALEAITWHAGPEANARYVGIECEGFAGEPLTSPQLATLIAVVRWVSVQDEWPAFQRSVTLWEHNEFMPTACPSGRIPWDKVIEGLAEAPGMGELDLLRGLVAAAHFARMNWDYKDLSEADKAAVRYVAGRLD